MDGISNIIGDGYVPVTLGGVEYQVSTKTLGHYAEIESFILARRRDVYAYALAWFSGLAKEERSSPEVRSVLQDAMQLANVARFATSDELAAYNGTPAGMGHRLWIGLRDKQPDVTLAVATEIVLRLAPDERIALEHAIDRADQRGLLKNSDGPAAGAETQ